MNIQSRINELILAHPVAYTAFVALGGAALWHQGIIWLETVGVDQLVGWVRSRQRRMAKAFGLSEQQLKDVEAGEAKALERAAEDLKKN